LNFAAFAFTHAMAQRTSSIAAGAGASLALRYCTVTTLMPAARNALNDWKDLGRSPRIHPPPWNCTTTGVGCDDGTW
jgi:hypothetical protein